MARCPFYKSKGSAIRTEIEFCRITCPECGGQSHIKIFEPGNCPHCGAPLGGLTDADLRAEPQSVTVSIDQLTGRAVVSPESA
jgi:Zn finger protein HypA/HybF involved in hydrogenase expression